MKQSRGWACPYCKKGYVRRSDAEECANECADVESPERCDIYECDGCSKKYGTKEECAKCEGKHDPYLIERAENQRKLEEAARHPQQKKL